MPINAKALPTQDIVFSYDGKNRIIECALEEVHLLSSPFQPPVLKEEPKHHRPGCLVVLISPDYAVSFGTFGVVTCVMNQYVWVRFQDGREIKVAESHLWSKFWHSHLKHSVWNS